MNGVDLLEFFLVFLGGDSVHTSLFLSVSFHYEK